jgi:hypothetical protein
VSFQAAREQFRTVLDSIGFNEWKDGFNTEDIPSSLIDGAYHLTSYSASAVSHNHTDLSVEQRIQVTVWRKGYKDFASGIDALNQDADLIFGTLLAPSNRLTPALKSIKFVSMTIEPLAVSNDNSAKLTLDFDCLVYFNLGG